MIDLSCIRNADPELCAAMEQEARKKGAATLYCQNTGEVVEYLGSNLRPGDVVLAKASHAMGFEQMLTALYAVLPAPAAPAGEAGATNT